MRDPSSQGYRLLDAVKGVHLTQRRTVFRAATAGSVILCLLILSFFFLYDDSSSDWDLPATIDASNIYSRRQIRLCDDYDKKGLPHLLTSEAKFDHLIDDQFTIVIQTYKRPDILNDTLYAIVEGESKMLHTIIVAWNDLETTVPADWTTPGGIKVHYRQSEKNSLNQKLRPDPRIKTKAVLLADDDTYYTQDDMEYAFKVWRETGQNRLVGAWPRAGRQNKGGKWIYSTPHKSYDYNLILTGLAFTHIAFMDYYSSEDRLMVKIRDYVDEHFNCEDIAMNYLTQSLTGCPALWVKGHDGAIKPPKPEDTPRIGHAKGHGARRTACLNDFNKFFGKMPLKTQDGYMIRGEVHAP